MNKALFGMNVKTNRNIWLIFFAILVMYVAIIVSIYDPSIGDPFAALMDMFPPELLGAMNFTIMNGELISFISGYLYGFIMFIPMIYVIIVGNRLIAKYVDSGSMAYLLSTPNKRRKIALTQAVFLFLSTTLLIVVVAGVNLLMCISMYPGLLDISKFIILNLGLIGYFTLISSITFLFSCIFNETRNSLAFGAGIPLLFFVINMLRGASPDLDFLKYFTALSLFDSNDWITGGNIVWIGSVAFFLTSILFYTLGIRIFIKKDLPL